MASAYYGSVRAEIAPLLPPTAGRILDVGCGTGATSSWLKARYPGCRTIGFEGNAALLPELTGNVDEAHRVDLNGELPEVGPVDLVLLLDILEHLVEPAAVLARIVPMMAEDATAIISLPNVAHLLVALDLLLRGRFAYADAGILDRTHLRFFYRESALALVRGAGLAAERGLLTGLHGRKVRWLDRLTFGTIRDRLAYQFIFSARRRQFVAGATVTWQLAAV